MSTYLYKGPIKEVPTAMGKAARKYSGDVLRVTDFCRAFIVVKDLTILLALFERLPGLVGSSVCRIKISSLKMGSRCQSGGYRDCKINLLVQGHVCEIQVHIEAMWCLQKIDGYSYHKNCVDHSVDITNEDPYDSLNGLDRQTL